MLTLRFTAVESVLSFIRAAISPLVLQSYNRRLSTDAVDASTQENQVMKAYTL